MSARKRGRPKKMDLATTNIKITKETHQIVKTLADMLGMSISDSLKAFILKYAPEIEAEMQRREEWRKSVPLKNGDDSA